MLIFCCCSCRFLATNCIQFWRNDKNVVGINLFEKRVCKQFAPEMEKCHAAAVTGLGHSYLGTTGRQVEICNISKLWLMNCCHSLTRSCFETFTLCCGGRQRREQNSQPGIIQHLKTKPTTSSSVDKGSNCIH